MNFNNGRLNTAKKIWPYVKDFNTEWVLLFIFKVSQNIPILLYPMVFKLFIDQVIEHHNINFIYKIILLYIGIYILETVLKVIHRYIDNYLFNEVAFELRTTMWEKYFYMPISKFREYHISDLKNRINIDVDLLKSFIITQIFDYITYIITFIGSAWMLLILDWRIAILCYSLIPVSLFISNRYQKKVGDLYEDERKTNDNIEQWMQISLSNWREIKANNFVNWHNKKYSDYLNTQYDISKKITMILLKRKTLLNLKDSLVNQLLIYVIGGILHFANSISVSTVIVSIQYYNKMLSALADIMKTDMEIEGLKPSINRVMEILMMEDFKKVGEAVETFNFSGNTIFEVDHLSYAYENNSKEILHDISFNIQEKDKIVIMGESGGGKTTLIKILTGDLVPPSGQVRFYGMDIATLSHQWLYKKITVIFQEPYFMNLSIKNYLLMANQNLTQTDMESACKKVNMLDYILQLPEGFDTKIGERGIRLSGGQKQRLSLARLFLSDSDIVVLDEAFSAIDGIDKSRLLKQLFEQYRDKTIICVSHDEDVAKYFNTKICINKGKVFIYD